MRLKIDTTEVKNLCNTFNGVLASADLGNIDLASAFEPFTSLGILTDYVSSLKSAMSTITTSCANISNELHNLANAQENVDYLGRRAADTGIFNNYDGVDGNGYDSSYGSDYGTAVDNGNSYIASHTGNNINNVFDSKYSISFEDLLSLMKDQPSGVSEEDKEAYLRELLKLKIQKHLENVNVGSVDSSDPVERVTYDILVKTAGDMNIELKDILNKDNIDTVREKVNEISQEYITIFNSNDLVTDLQNIYNGVNIEGKDKTFVSTVKAVIDAIAKKENITEAELLNVSNYALLKEEIGHISESISQLTNSGNDNQSFLDSLKAIFKIEM